MFPDGVSSSSHLLNSRAHTFAGARSCKWMVPKWGHITRIQRTDSRASAGRTLVANTCPRHWQSVRDNCTTDSHRLCWHLAWHSKLFLHCLTFELDVGFFFIVGPRHGCGVPHWQTAGRRTRAAAPPLAGGGSASGQCRSPWPHVWNHIIVYHYYHIIVISWWYYVNSYMKSCVIWFYPFLGSCYVFKKAWFHMVYHEKLIISHDPKNG